MRLLTAAWLAVHVLTAMSVSAQGWVEFASARERLPGERPRTADKAGRNVSFRVRLHPAVSGSTGGR